MSDGRYESSLRWKVGHTKLPTNINVAKSRVQSLIRELERSQPDMLKAYNEIVQSQKDIGIVEIAPEVVRGTEK